MWKAEDHEFVNIDQRDTGIKYKDIVIQVYSGKGLKHGPRVKVSNIKRKYSYDNFSITLSDYKVVGKVKLTTKEVDAVIEWMKLNNDALHTYWSRGDLMLTDDFFASLKTI